MFPWDIDFWWCCLNPRERVVLRSTIDGIALTLNVGIPKPLWDTFWLGTLNSGEPVRDAFLSIYGLEIVTIPLGEPPVDTQVVRAKDGLTYAAWFVYIFTPAAACLSGCQQSSVP